MIPLNLPSFRFAKVILQEADDHFIDTHTLLLRPLTDRTVQRCRKISQRDRFHTSFFCITICIISMQFNSTCNGCQLLPSMTQTYHSGRARALSSPRVSPTVLKTTISFNSSSNALDYPGGQHENQRCFLYSDPLDERNLLR